MQYEIRNKQERCNWKKNGHTEPDGGREHAIGVSMLVSFHVDAKEIEEEEGRDSERERW